MEKGQNTNAGLTKSQQKRQKAQWRKKRTGIIAALLLAGFMAFSATSPGRAFWRGVNGGDDLSGITAQMRESPLVVYFMDVGKADAILVTCEGQNALIDAGTYADGDTVEIWLKKLGIERLDAVFASHPDSDHIGGIAHILNTFTVDQLVVSDTPAELLPNTDEYRAMMSAVEENDVSLLVLEAGDTFPFGGGTFEILGPVGNHTDVNNYFLVQKLIYRDVSILFSGDIEKRAEQFLCESGADLTADVLKVGHHGSRTSSTQEFLEAVGADYAIVTTGTDSNNLPNKDVLQRLEACGMEVYRTDAEGTIVLSSDSYEIVIET